MLRFDGSHFWGSGKCYNNNGVMGSVGIDGRPKYIGSLPHAEGEYPKYIDYSICNCGYIECWTDMCNCDSCRVADGSLFDTEAGKCEKRNDTWGSRYIRQIVSIHLGNATPVFAAVENYGVRVMLEKLLIDGSNILFQARFYECNPWDLSTYGDEGFFSIVFFGKTSGNTDCSRWYSISESSVEGMNRDMWEFPSYGGKYSLSNINDMCKGIKQYRNRLHTPYDITGDDDFE